MDDVGLVFERDRKTNRDSEVSTQDDVQPSSLRIERIGSDEELGMVMGGREMTGLDLDFMLRPKRIRRMHWEAMN